MADLVPGGGGGGGGADVEVDGEGADEIVVAPSAANVGGTDVLEIVGGGPPINQRLGIVTKNEELKVMKKKG